MNIEQLLDELVPNPKCELNFQNVFQLLVATILSAQCTDKRVNLVTGKLFKKYPTPEYYLSLSVQELGQEIYSLGFYNTKAQNIINLCKELMEKYGGKVPDTMNELTALSGVGRKTASVVISEGFKRPAFAVDTHVFRVANRLGIGNAKSVDLCEKALKNYFPKKSWSKVHLQMVHFGRYFCKAKNPLCETCKFQKKCLYYKSKKD